MAVTSITANNEALIITDSGNTYNLQKKDVFTLATSGGLVHIDTATRGIVYVPVAVATQSTIQGFLDAMATGTVTVSNFPATYPNGLLQGVTDEQMRASPLPVAGTVGIGSDFLYKIDGTLKGQGTGLGSYNFFESLLPNLFNFLGTGSATYAAQGARLSVTANQYIVGQSNVTHRYIPGNPHLIEFTFDSVQTLSSCDFEIGYGNDSNVAPYSGIYDGFRFRFSNGLVYLEVIKEGVTILSVERASWDNTLSGYNFDNFTVAAIDFLYLGGVGCRFFVVVDGVFVLAHTFNFAGTAVGTFIANPSSYVRFALRSTGGSKTVNVFCARVLSEGSNTDTLGYVRSHLNASFVAASIGTTYAIMGVRLKTLNHHAVVKLTKALAFISSVDNAIFSIILNPTISGTFAYSGVTGESYEIAQGTGVATATGGITRVIQFGTQNLSSALDINDILNQLYTGIDNTQSTLVFCCTPTTNNVTVQGCLELKIF